MKTLFGSFLGIGILCLAITALIYSNNSKFLENATVTTGTVISNSYYKSMAYPKVRFETTTGLQTEFKSKYGQSPAQYSVGDEVTILYPPNNPNKAKIKPFSNFGLAGLIVGPIGSIFFTIGFVVLFKIYRRQYHQWWAKRKGIPIQAKVVKIAIDHSYMQNGKSPWFIMAHWKDPKKRKTYKFRSELLWTDPALKKKIGDSIQIYIDPRNPTIYSMQELI